MSRDIVHAQRGFRRRSCGDFVNRFTEGEALPMDWEEYMQLPTGNEIRFADEILPGRQDEIVTLCRRYPLLWSGRNPDQPSQSGNCYGLASDILTLFGLIK